MIFMIGSEKRTPKMEYRRRMAHGMHIISPQTGPETEYSHFSNEFEGRRGSPRRSNRASRGTLAYFGITLVWLWVHEGYLGVTLVQFRKTRIFQLI